MPKILAIDDDRTVLHMVRTSLREIDDAEVLTSLDPDEGLQLLNREQPDVVLLDIMFPDASGLEIFQKIHRIDKRLPVIFITASNDSGTAIEAMQLGAYDYLTKPLDLKSLNELVERALESRRLMHVPVAVPTGHSEGPPGDAFLGRSPVMLDVFKQIGRVAGQNVTVLIRGESGTGKELVARSVYQHSKRNDKPFLAVNCAALPESLLESELFGHEKGSFTGADRRRIGKFEQCSGGTLFLDEVGDMSPAVQGKVLRVLQEQKFERVGGNQTISTDVRIITATNRPLEQMVEDGDFRKDLLYRLNSVTITLPPLRERREDLPTLLEHYLGRLSRELERPDIEGISPEALELLQSYDWPGNVRELQSALRRSLLNTTGPVVVPQFLPPEIRGETPHHDESSGEDDTLPASDIAPFISQRLTDNSTDLYAESISEFERYLFTRVLRHTGGNQSKASEILGITRGKVADRIKTFGITVEKSVSLDDGEQSASKKK